MKTTLLVIGMFLGSLSSLALGSTSNLNTIHGTTRGMVSSEPDWSAGLQIGNFGSTALVVQKMGAYQGAINLGMGVAWGSVTMHGDYLVLLTESFRLRSISPSEGYNGTRGQFLPFFGGGLQVGRGFLLRAPLGVQYTMTKDPVNFFGGIVPMFGRFLADQDAGFNLWFHVGARLLL